MSGTNEYQLPVIRDYVPVLQAGMLTTASAGSTGEALLVILAAVTAQMSTEGPGTQANQRWLHTGLKI